MGLSDAIMQIWKNHAIAMVVIFAAILAAGFYFKVNISTLLFLIILACPLMHLFMMGDHGSHGNHEKEEKDSEDHSEHNGEPEKKTGAAYH